MGLGDFNYCRNPDGNSGIWCYTTDPKKRWEACDPVKVEGRYADIINNNVVIKTSNGFTSQVWYFDQRSKTIKSQK